MSTFLYKIGKSAYSKPWYFIVSWIAILGVVLALIGINGIHVGSEMKIEGTESQKVLDQLAEELPEASGGQASVVFEAPEGERLDTPERVALLSKAVNDVYNLEYVINAAKLAADAAAANTEQAQGAAADSTQQAATADSTQQQAASSDAASAATFGPLMDNGVPVTGVTLSADGSVALFQFQFTVQQMDLPQEVLDSVINTVTAVEQGGLGIKALPSDTLSSKPAVGATEGIGIVVAAIVLFITLGSIVAAGLPLLTALLGVGISVGGAYAFSKFIGMTDVTPALALMVGLAVGIDYCLFIVNRQRRMMLDNGLSAREAASRAIGTAGSAVFFAGLTVIIALCGMLVIGIAFLSTMALVAAASVFINVLIALTLLPALLGLVGERICSEKARKNAASKGKSAARHGFAYRWANGTVKYRWPIIIASVVILGVAAIPVAKMDMGIPSGATANFDTATRQSYDAITKGFGEGFNGSLLLVARPNDASNKVTPEVLGALVQGLQQHDDVMIVNPMGINETGDLAIISLIPNSGPTDAITKDLVNDLRDPNSAIAQASDVSIGVTGFTAINIDMSAKLAEVFPLYVGIIVILSIIILLLVFRSVIVPIKATIGFLLSILATFGITTAVFQWGWLHSLFGFDTGGPLLSFMPIMVTGILYGLAMDYQVFLVSSMRESYVHGHKGTASVVSGYEQASRVVLAAAVIMVSVFAGFVLTEDIMIKQIGFALAAGILIDAFIVRMTLVPAIMAVFSDRAWSLPRWLDRLLPNLDVEGDKLIAELNAQEEQHGHVKPKVSRAH
ncbi:RND superfamily putative drug exporter [Paenibacillus cellulosilyticus]|uniref:RND superfamily putative drug exporter n=1 Tax=Paenibacillus cellulosilyticus TaxID=375489 RepID=A0A2V2YZ64_9BACL|nr:MMPL family transporter [Paenibacillus cellulosilyticus]PWW05154.1 RND superfamily putative drug exporter [Paenibacillus cellulosilyticus]QKS48694.1 MMPL family transporter [Paenibacillus cellulosilyticus]